MGAATGTDRRLVASTSRTEIRWRVTGGWRSGHRPKGGRLDDDVVAVSPSTVYRTLKTAGRLDSRRWSPSKKGTGFVQPLAAHDHWHVDISYIHVAGTFYYLTSVLDGFSRYIVHWEIRETMTEADVETIVQRALEKHPGAKPRIISDNGPQSGHPVLRVGSRFQGVHSPGGHHPRADESVLSAEQRQARTLAWQPEAGVHPTRSAGFAGGGSPPRGRLRGALQPFKAVTCYASTRVNG